MTAGMDARSLAHALGGDVVGRDKVTVPGPGHSPRDRSLSIKLDPNAPDGFRFTRIVATTGNCAATMCGNVSACLSGNRATSRTGAFHPPKSKPGT